MEKSTLYKNKYRRESCRLKNWDYSWNGHYYLTLCTKNRAHFFGNIINGRMQLSASGLIVQSEWLKSFAMRTELSCDTYCIMPDHMHAIVVIKKTHGVVRPIPLDSSISNYGIAIRQPKSISSFIAGFKSVCTKAINEYQNQPASSIWQPRYYDHIVRNETHLIRIRKYIIENPRNW